MQRSAAFLLGVVVGAAGAWALARVVPAQAETRGSTPANAVPARPEAWAPRGADRKATVDLQLARGRVAALEGDVPGTLAAIGQALDGGVRAADAWTLIDALPAERRRDAYLELLSRRTPPIPDVAAFAIDCLANGLVREGFDMALRLLGSDDDDLRGLAGAMVHADAARAERELAALALAKGWSNGNWVRVARALIDGRREDLARGFLLRAVDAGRVEGFDDLLSTLRGLDPDAALRCARRCLDGRSPSLETWQFVASLEAERGNRDAAFETCRLALARFPDSEELVEQFVGIDANRAVPALARLAEDSSNDECLGTAAKACLRCGLLSEAAAAYAAAHERDPWDSEWLRGLVALDPKLAEARIDALLGAVSRRTSGVDELVGARAQLLLKRGDRPAAFAAFEEAWALDREDSEWMRGMADADPARAATLFEARLAGGDGTRDVKGALGDACARLGRLAEARQLYEAALEEEDEPCEWDAARARVDPEGALARLHGFVESQEANEDAWGYLGLALEEIGRVDEARAAYDRALERAPGHSKFALRRALLR